MTTLISTCYLLESIKYDLYDIGQTKFPVSRTFQSCKCFFLQNPSILIYILITKDAMTIDIFFATNVNFKTLVKCDCNVVRFLM